MCPIIFGFISESVFVGVVCFFEEEVCTFAHVVELIVAASPDRIPIFCFVMVYKRTVFSVPYHKAVAAYTIVPFEVLAVSSDCCIGVEFALLLKKAVCLLKLLLGSTRYRVLHSLALGCEFLCHIRYFKHINNRNNLLKRCRNISLRLCRWSR